MEIHKDSHRGKKIHDQYQQGMRSGRFLITINVIGSAGPLRFLVNGDDLVTAVIATALRSYARAGRLPVLGSDLNKFLLYSTNAGSDALSPSRTIGSYGVRNFLLCKKLEAASDGSSLGRKGGGSWKNWLNKAINLKVYFH